MILVSQKEPGLLDDTNVILLQSKNLHFSKVVNPWFWSKIKDIFWGTSLWKRARFLSLDDVVFTKGGFLDEKKCHFTIVEKFTFLQGVLTRDSGLIFQIFSWACFFVKEDLA